MKLKILFFGAAADAAGSRELQIKLDEVKSLNDVVALLVKDRTSLASLKLLTAVNEEYADPETILRDGDEVALFTAVSGG